MLIKKLLLHLYKQNDKTMLVTNQFRSEVFSTAHKYHPIRLKNGASKTWADTLIWAWIWGKAKLFRDENTELLSKEFNDDHNKLMGEVTKYKTL